MLIIYNYNTYNTMFIMIGFKYHNFSGQITTASAEVTLNGGLVLVRE